MGKRLDVVNVRDKGSELGLGTVAVAMPAGAHVLLRLVDTSRRALTLVWLGCGEG